ncbi:hypothetical protein ScPMuIL_007890 [Solemya velum]
MAARWYVNKWAPILMGYFSVLSIVFCTNERSNEVVLLDTKKSPRLGWTSHINNQESTNDGWDESSFNDENELIRVYSSCYVSSHHVDNWLRTPFIKRNGSNSLHIDMRFTMRRCIRHIDPGSLQQCKETFNLYYFEADSDFANELMPTWDSTAYEYKDKIAAETLYATSSEVEINLETRTISLDRGLGGVYFAFQDTGSCVTLISIKVYYIVCPNRIQNYVQLPRTATGSNPNDLKEEEGTCVANSVLDSTPIYLCRSDGTWYHAKGGCDCIAGYEGKRGVECSECQPNHFKSVRGNGSCVACPAHSSTNQIGSTYCPCDVDYFRGPEDEKHVACYQPPSEPLALRCEIKTSNMIKLSWQHPQYDGGRPDVTYRVECGKCGLGVEAIPRWSNFSTTRFTLRNLSPSTSYTIQVFAENGVSASSGHFSMKEITVKTESSIPTITNVEITNVGATTVTIGWDLGPNIQHRVIQFEVISFPRSQPHNKTSYMTNVRNFTFRDLKRNTNYGFQVRGETELGFGDLSEPIFMTTGTSLVETEISDQMPSVGIIVGAIVAVILCMAIATIMIVILLRRNRNHCSEMKSAECDTLQYSHVVSCPPLEPHYNGGLTVPLFQSSSSVKTYVDPHTYEDPNQAVREFTREIDPGHIIIESVIGGGEFGDVCKGKLRLPARPEMTVAIKTLKPGATDKNRMDFLTEASIMGQFDDPNVIFLEGVVTKGHPIMIATEYMANGSLDTFLRNNDGKFTVIQLIGMMRGIASGMRYLSEMGYVHRDLAARNILVNETLVCKVADFGLSREVDIDTTDGAYTTKGGKIPVRWTAPEAISFRKFTSASDVWSYGVVMWEVISYGERPYWNWSNQDVIKAVDKGYRLPPPMDCPEAIHQLMLDSWQKERSYRPKFMQIVKTLDKLIRAPELLRKIAKARPLHFPESMQTTITQFSRVEEWLVASRWNDTSNIFCTLVTLRWTK